MPSILHSNEKISFIARKNFKHRGEQFTTGQDVTEVMNDHPKLEVFVRNGYVVPVVDDEADIPFQFRHTVMTRERAAIRLARGNPGGQADGKFLGRRAAQDGKEEVTLRSETEPQPGADADGFGGDAPEPEAEFDPAKHTTEEVLDYVENNPDEVLSVYALEESGKQRKGLLAKLDEILNAQAEEESEGESND